MMSHIQYWGTVKVREDRNANIYRDPATGTFRYYLQGQRKGKTEWSADFESFAEAAEDAQSDWLNSSERGD